MKKLAVVTLGILGLVVAALLFVVHTTAGLRWTVDQALSRTGAPVEIGAVHGRLLGPVSLSDVSYRDPQSGTRLRVDTIELDWRPGALLEGLLHVTHLHTAGVEYTPGTSPGKSEPGQASLPEISLPVAVRLDDLQLDELVTVDDTGHATMLVQRASLRVSANAEAVLLSEIAVDAGPYAVDQGRIRLQPSAGLPVVAALDWRAAPPGLPAFRGHLNVEGVIGETLRPEIEIKAPFEAHGHGTLSALMLGKPRWTLAANLPEPVSLDEVMAALPRVSVQGTVHAEGSTGRARLKPDLSLTYRGTPVRLAGEIDISPKAAVVQRARLSRPDAPDTVTLSGRLGLSSALPFTVQGEWQSLSGPEGAAWASRSGEFQAEGDTTSVTGTVSGEVTPPGQSEASAIDVQVTASGLDAQPQISGSAHLPYFTFSDIAGRDVDVDIDFRSAGDRESEVLVKASTLTVAGREATGIELQARGSPARHEVSLTGGFDGWAIETAVTGAYEDNRWEGRVERLSAAPPAEIDIGQWVMARSATVTWSPSRTEIHELCLENAATQLCVNGFFTSQAEWHASAGVTGLPLQRLARNTPEDLRVDGTLEARVDIGDDGGGLSGEARATVDRATVAWRAEDPVTTEYRDVALDAILTPEELRVTLQGKLDDSGSIEGELVTRDPFGEDGALQGSISARLPSLRIIQAAVPALGLREGTASVALSVDGTRSTPQVHGDGRIEQAVLDVDPLGIRLQDLGVKVSSDNRSRLNIEAHAVSGDGPLSATGYIEWPAEGGWRGQMQLEGNGTTLVRLPKAVIDGSPDLQITADQSGGSVTGRVRITRAELTPEAGRPAVTLSDDIVIKGRDDTADQAARNPMAWHARISIELGDDVRFKGYGVRGRLSGAIDVDAPPRQPLRANGSIQVHDGEYSLYGRTFEIERGRLVYTGGPVDNPGIDVAVTKKVRDVSISLTISGPLVDPALILTSTPSMSDTDKMSYLLLGRPASQASEAEAGLLLRAAASLIPGSGRGVPQYIQSTLGLDTFEVRAESQETEGAAVELGKYLAPDLYVSYIAGFQQAVDVFRVRYDLARHWLLQAESTTRGSGGDLLFTW